MLTSLNRRSASSNPSIIAFMQHVNNLYTKLYTLNFISGRSRVPSAFNRNARSKQWQPWLAACQRKRLHFLRFSFTQRMQLTQRKRLRLNGNWALLKLLLLKMATRRAPEDINLCTTSLCTLYDHRAGATEENHHEMSNVVVETVVKLFLAPEQHCSGHSSAPSIVDLRSGLPWNWTSHRQACSQTTPMGGRPKYYGEKLRIGVQTIFCLYLYLWHSGRVHYSRTCI